MYNEPSEYEIDTKPIKDQDNLVNDREERLSFLDEELQFILENFEFQPDFTDEVLIIMY
jgi:hypothetical protein